MTLPRGITLPSATAVGGGVLAQSRELPDGWTRGVEFADEACLIAGTHVFCTTSPGEKDFQEVTLAEFTPYGVEVSVQCTTLESFTDRQTKARAALSIVAEFNVGFELATSTVNPSLADATALTAGATAAEALGIIEESIASNLRGRLAWVHVAPQRLVELAAADVVYLDDEGNWRTPTGHLVVASPGYVAALADKIVATPEVFASISDVEQIRTFDRSDNRHMAVYEAAALAVFDDCFNVSSAIETS